MDTAGNVMNRNVISIPSDSTVEQAIRTLLAHGISGAPVTDREGNLVGIVSEFQLLEVVYEPKLRMAPVNRFMTKDVLTVDEDTLLSEVTRILIVQRIRRVPVVRNGRLVGLISRRDLLRYVLDASEEVTEHVKTAKAPVG